MCDLVCKGPSISYSNTSGKISTVVKKETNVSETKQQISQDEISK